jgi:hypothetical protein
VTPLARHLLGRVPAGVTTPRYGSTEWDGLPDQDPRRAAAVIIAAEALVDLCRAEMVSRDLRVIAEQMRAELAVEGRRFRETSWDVSRALIWAREAHKVPFAEVKRRRAS